MSKRKIGIIIGAVCLLVVAGGFVAIRQYEATLRGDIATFLAGLSPSVNAKAETIDVSFFDKSVTLTNLAGTAIVAGLQDDEGKTVPMTFSIASIVATGINVDGFKEGAGAVKLFDSLRMRTIVMDAPTLTATIERYDINDVSGDFGQIRQVFPEVLAAGIPTDAAGNDERLLRAMAALLKAYETVHVGSAAMGNYKYSFGVDEEKFEMVLGSVEGKEYSTRKMGPVAVREVTASYNGKPVLQLDEITLDEIVLPSFVGLFEMLAEDSFLAPEMVQSLFKGQTFAMKNLRLKNMNLYDPLRDVTVVSRADMDLSYLAETAHTADFSFKNLTIAKSLLAQQAGLPESVFASLPDSIAFEGVFQSVSTPKANNFFDVDFKKLFLKGDGLGEASLSFAANDISLIAVAMGMPQGTLKHFDLAMTDRGFSDVVFAVEGLGSDTPAGETRAGFVALLREQSGNTQNQVEKDLFNGCVAFLEKIGQTLRIAVKPEQPSTTAQLMQAYSMDPAALGLTVTVTPANQE